MITPLLKSSAFALLASLLLTVPVWAVPPLPFSPYNRVTMYGNDVATGTAISAKCGSVTAGTTTAIIFEGHSVYSLNVLGNDTDTEEKDGCDEGETVTFWVSGVQADQTATWVSGADQELNLTVSAVTPPAQQHLYLPLIVRR